MRPRWALPLLISFAIIVLVGGASFLFDRTVVAMGVGVTNLDIDFIVVDCESKAPIPNATIEIHSDGGFYEGADNEIGKTFELKTDANGIARRQCRGVWFEESWGALGFARTYGVRIPRWQVRARANKFEHGAWVDLGIYRGKTQHDGPQLDRLQVGISLKKMLEVE